MEDRYPLIGTCGLSCRLCPRHHTEGTSRCPGCRSPERRAAGCPFLTCAVKKRQLAFCWDCPDSGDCGRWQAHRDAGTRQDSFISYQSLEEDIAWVRDHGIGAFDARQAGRAELLAEMLEGFNDGRSKQLYCTAASVLAPETLRQALEEARRETDGGDRREAARILRGKLEAAARRDGRVLSLRKGTPEGPGTGNRGKPGE